MNRKSFSTITLLNGHTCGINEPKAYDVMRANFQMLLLDSEHKVGFSPYLIQQLITINEKQPSLDYVFNLSIDDYNSINEVIEVSMKKIKI